MSPAPHSASTAPTGADFLIEKDDRYQQGTTYWEWNPEITPAWIPPLADLRRGWQHGPVHATAPSEYIGDLYTCDADWLEIVADHPDEVYIDNGFLPSTTVLEVHRDLRTRGYAVDVLVQLFFNPHSETRTFPPFAVVAAGLTTTQTGQQLPTDLQLQVTDRLLRSRDTTTSLLALNASFGPDTPDWIFTDYGPEWEHKPDKPFTNGAHSPKGPTP